MSTTVVRIEEQPGLTSVRRALRLLRLFIDSEHGVSVTEAANSLGAAKSTISRMLTTMAAEGFAVLGPEDRRYHVGPVAFQVGSRFVGAALARTIQPIVRAASEETGCTAQIGTLRGSHVLYLSVTESSRRLRVVAAPGDMRYAHASAMGKALLADLDAASRELHIKAMLGDDLLLPPSGPNTIRDLVRLHRELDLTRRRGYSKSDEEATEGVGAVGVVVPVPLGLPLALSVAYPVGQFNDRDRKTLATVLEGAARSVGEKLAQSRTST